MLSSSLASLVVCASHALQGHPETGKLVEELANDILINCLGFRTTANATFASHTMIILSMSLLSLALVRLSLLLATLSIHDVVQPA
jgi:hypothetical protein